MILMGGRGGSSGFSYPTSEQQRRMNRLREIGQRDNYRNIQFERNRDGSIDFSYERQRRVEYVHGGKMQDPNKNDTYERTEYHTGKIMPDGLIKRNKTTKEDKLIRRGRR